MLRQSESDSESTDMTARSHDAQASGRNGILSLLLSVIMLVKPSILSAQASQPQGPAKEPQKVEAPQKDTAKPSEAVDAVVASDSPYLQAVRTFADNVLKYGRDTYGPKHTPLFVDGLNIHTHEPVKWISPKGDVFTATETEEWILSNFASQQTFLRTLDGLSSITGDPKYHEAAKEATRYAFEHLTAFNGLFYWGHAAAYDAQADKIYSLDDTHTLKIHYPYYELMWRVDPEATRRFIEAFWSAHVIDWSNLDFCRISVPYSDSLETPWNQEYKGGPTFFKSKRGVGFFHTGTSLTHAGAMLYRFSGQKQPLVWSERLMQRFVDTRHPNTGISAHIYSTIYNAPQRMFTNHNMAEHFRNPYTTVFPFHPFEGQRKLQLTYFGENWQPLPWISLLFTGDMLGEPGKEFTQWALEELTAWGKASYRKRDNAFVPILTDGTNIEGVVLEETCALGLKGDSAKTLFAGPEYFWAYATAYRVTGDEFMWQMARDIGSGNGLGDIGESPKHETDLRPVTTCSDVYALLGCLELYTKTGNLEFLRIARNIADNIVKTKFHKGFFVLSKEHIYARFGCLEPLALLHVAEAIDSGKLSMPQVWPECPIFVPPYRYKEKGNDRWYIYRLTDSPEVPWSLQEAAHIGNINQVKAFLESGTNVDSADDKYGGTAVQRAARRGHKEIVELLLVKGAYPNSDEGWPGGTALDYAAENGHKEIVELLIAKGANLNAKRRGYPAGDRPLHSAVKAGHKDIVELLIQGGADVNVQNKAGDTPLHCATQPRGIGVEIIELLIAKGADLDSKNNDGKTPLDIAVTRNRPAIAKLLIEKGAAVFNIHTATFVGNLEKVRSFIEAGTDVNGKDENGMTPLLRAVSGGHAAVVDFLVHAGADVNTGDKWGYVPLVYALWNMDSDMVKLLLDKGADANAKDTPSGYTVLHWAVMMDSKESTELLLAPGADVNAKSNAGETPLDFAAYGSSPVIGGLLLAKGAEVSSLHAAAYLGDLTKVKAFIDEGVEVDTKSGTMGGTALHSAAAGGHREVAEFLIHKGSDVDAQMRGGQTPLHMAAEGGHLDVAELLLSRGADINAKDKRGRTPLDLAQSAGHAQIVDLLYEQMLVYDVSVAKVTAAPSCAQGQTVSIVVTARNQGDSSGSVAVRLTSITDGVDIGNQTIAVGDVADLVFSPENEDKNHFGNNICIGGDANGDGYLDVLIGARDWQGSRGRAYLYFGGPDMDSHADMFFTGENTRDYFSDQSGAFGDLNHDGYADVIIGAFGYPGGKNDGRVYVYYGGPAMDNVADMLFEGELGQGSLFGLMVTTSDINHDGHIDLLIGAQNHDHGGEYHPSYSTHPYGPLNGRGRVYLFWGGDPMDTTPDIIFEGEKRGDWFGRRITARGDVNSDGYKDILIGARHAGEEDKGEILSRVVDDIFPNAPSWGLFKLPF